MGFSIGGFVTVLVGTVVSSLQTIALGLAGFADLGLLYHGAQQLLDNARSCPSSFGTVGGVAAVAIVVAALNSMSSFSGRSLSAVGTGMFLAGFLLYIAV
jgi:hypothetical protein